MIETKDGVLSATTKRNGNWILILKSFLQVTSQFICETGARQVDGEILRKTPSHTIAELGCERNVFSFSIMAQRDRECNFGVGKGTWEGVRTCNSSLLCCFRVRDECCQEEHRRKHLGSSYHSCHLEQNETGPF